MALNAKNIPSTGGTRKKEPSLEAGAYPARLVQIIDLGVQEQRAYKGEPKPPKPEIYTTYELLDEFMTDDDGNELEDKPRWVSERLPMNSLDSDLANSTKRYLALDPDMEHDGDWSQLIGKPCLVTVTKSKKKVAEDDKNGNPLFANYVASTGQMRAKDAQKAEGLKNDPKIFDMDDPDMEVFNSLPNWLQGVVKESLNFGGSALEKAIANGGEEEKPKKEEKTKKEAPVKEEDESDDGDW